jgi:hypothetical protein
MHVLLVTNFYQIFIQERVFGLSDHRIPLSPDLSGISVISVDQR